MDRDHIEIRPARPDSAELMKIADLLQEGAERMKSLGSTQWEPEQLEGAHLEAAAKARELFVVLKNGEAVATFKAQPEDPVFWPEMDADEAIYLHKIAVTGKLRGQGITGEIIRWARAFAKSEGRRYLRLDTDRMRPGLCRLYSELGFAFHSFKNLGWIEVVRFQMSTENTG